MSIIASFEAAEAFLYELPNFGKSGNTAYKPGLERVHALLAEMNDPHHAYPSVHVAGTNGKGSTCSMIAAIATASGQRVGLHTSPHLFHLCERMRVDGKPASESWLVDAVHRFGDAIKDLGASFFEATVALSLLYFCEKEVDLAVVEVGLGGRLDATNVLQPRLAAITRIGWDHVDILGDSLTKIATEKAGIIKEDIPVAVGLQEPEALETLRKQARSKKAPWHAVEDEVTWKILEQKAGETHITLQTPGHVFEEITIGLTGEHQVQNAALAIRVIELLSPEQSVTQSILEGLSHVSKYSGLRGRLDICKTEPLVVLDVGHNIDGLQVALAFMSKTLLPRRGQLYVAFGMMRDKDLRSVGHLFSSNEAKVIALHSDTERAFTPDEIAQHLNAAGVSVQVVQDAGETLDRFYEVADDSDGLLITGSHRIASQFVDLIN